MTNKSLIVFSLLLALTIFATTNGQGQAPTLPDPSQAREIASFDRSWKFNLGDVTNAQSLEFDDSKWRSLDIPHDWMIEGAANAYSDPHAEMEGPFDKNSPAAGSGGYLNGGVAWYRKTFTLPESARGRRISILFDGAYMKAEVYLNGIKLGDHPYGYTSFYYDLTSHANYGPEKNVIAVRLDVKQPCSRWYSGGGLYRHVWLVETQPVHIPQWGTYIKTPEVSDTSARVEIKTDIINDSATLASTTLTTIVLDPNGKEVARRQDAVQLAPGSGTTFDQNLSVSAPRLWSPETPVLYRAISELRVGGALTDSYTTPFGIRTIQFTKDNGFLLNGKRVQLKGVCDHHDLGCLGSIALKRGFERQLQILKSMGCNALRTSHNPPSPEMLDLCDRMGFLVMDECFDEWKINKTNYGYGYYFDAWSQKDLVSMLHRDRNHPSIVLWSIGNEVAEGYSENGSTVAQPLTDTCHREDPSRPVTSALPNPTRSLQYHFEKALDVFGVNYGSIDIYNDSRVKGVMPVIGSETSSQVDTRGEYGLYLDPKGNIQIDPRPSGQVSSYDLFHPDWAQGSERALMLNQQTPWSGGEFVWTGFDYIGEPTPNNWPARSSYFGINDLCGFPKDRFYLYQSQWSNTPMVHIVPSSWNWAGFEGKNIPVHIFTNGDSVELFLNGKSLGVKHNPADVEDGPGKSLHLAWGVPYVSGELKAVASKDGKIVATDILHTAGAPAKIMLTPDRDKIAANGQDLSFIKVAVVDKDGSICPDADNEIKFSIDGATATLAGLDNGDPINHEAFQGTQHKAFHGLALAVLKSGYDATGAVTLTASIDGLPAAKTTVTVAAP